jgi:hypothetical protein
MNNNKRGFYEMYRSYILLNKNIIVSGILAFFSGAAVTQIYSQYNNNHLFSSVIALTTEYAIYIPLFAYLYYRDNRAKYFDPVTGKKDSLAIKKDIKKLLAAFSISEIVYAVAKLLLQYELLRVLMEPYQASMISSIVAWVFYLVSINATVKMVKLFRK